MNLLLRLLPTLFVLLVILFAIRSTTAASDDDEDLPDFDFDEPGLDYASEAKTNAINEHEELFAQRERKIRQVLIRALSNGRLRQKFAEVMPVLRMMTKSQRLTLAALIQAQVDGNRILTLEQVFLDFEDCKRINLLMA